MCIFKIKFQIFSKMNHILIRCHLISNSKKHQIMEFLILMKHKWNEILKIRNDNKANGNFLIIRGFKVKI